MFGRYKVGQVYQHYDVKLFFSVIIKVSSDKVIDPGTLSIRPNLQNGLSPF